MSSKTKWYMVYDHVVGLASWLVYERGLDAKELVAFLEKPWKWTPEWEEWHRDPRYFDVPVIEGVAAQGALA